MSHKIMETQRDTKRIILTEDIDADIAVGKTKTKATIIDLSTNGARIAYAGAPLDIDTDVEIVSDDLFMLRQTQVVWSKPLDAEISMMGLRFNEIV
ncbi:MAG: PilZ domain-containing protein [Nitrospinota bacterium]